ncbi:POT family MFS transporter [Planctomicrobium sp. SH664]|uniref:POT family MFS transporter n=1 Tax=Planctomicrobium sp. SH664 TaxID=3448125 RepID=UPI003F5B45CB
MPKPAYLTAPPNITHIPPGIPYIVGNEAAERFSFYGMKAILATFMTKALLNAAGEPDVMSEAAATERIHQFVAAAYFFPIVGAVVADWLLGKYRTILCLSLVYCLGHLVLALMDFHTGIDQRVLLGWGLGLIAIGSGGIKPCVSSHVGDQFGHSNQALLAVVFGWFYFSINFGSTFSTLLTPHLAREYGYSWAFGVPGVLMGVATFVFWLGRNQYVHIPPSGREFFERTFSAVGVRAILNLIPLYLIIAVFWSLYDQTASRWVLQADRMDCWLPIFGTVQPAQLQAVNPVLVMLLIPFCSYVFYPLLGKLFAVTPLRKIGIGLFLMIPAFLIPAWLEMRIEAGETPYCGWQILAYVFLTLAEVMISITGLEFSYTQAPNEMKSFIMGLYMLSVFAGNLFTALVNGAIAAAEKSGSTMLEGANYYLFFTVCVAAAGIVHVIWSQFYRGQTYLQEEKGAASPS